MKLSLFFAAILTMLSLTAHAACEPPTGKHQTKCQNCGNLEQNPDRGIEIAWTHLLENPEMLRELGNTGQTEVVLTNPPYASHGVLFYTALIRDPSFEIVDNVQHAKMIALQRQYDGSVSGSINTGGARAEGRFQESQSLRRQIEVARSLAIRTSTKPYEIKLVDQNGRQFPDNTRSMPRNNPPIDIAEAGDAEYLRDDKYEEPKCFDKDTRPRMSDRGRRGGTGAGGSGRDEGGRGRGSCNATPHTSCRSDFSNPGGSGVICHTGGTITCA